MKSKSIFLIAVSLGFGLVAAIGITQVMGRKAAEPKDTIKTVPVLVAIEDLDINPELQSEMFKVEEWPEEIVPEGVVSSLEEIENKVNRSRVGKKGPVYLTDLLNKNEVNNINIPAGFKVIGIKLSADDHLYGLLQPGDLVDVIGVFRGRGQNSGSSSKTFLRKIRVFSVASRTSKSAERDPTAKGSTIVGLLVTEKQSEQIVLVQKVADLKLVMRSNEDTDLAATSDGTDLGFTNGTAVGEASNALAGMFRNLASGGSSSGSTSGSMGVHITTVYTSEGPTQYRFDSISGSSVPTRIKGFGDDDAADSDETDDEFDGISDDADSNPSTEELDSEPSN